MRHVVSVIVLGMMLALGTSAARAEDCHGQGQYFRHPTPPPPQAQTPNPPQDVAPVGSEPSPPSLPGIRDENMGH